MAVERFGPQEIEAPDGGRDAGVGQVVTVLNDAPAVSLGTVTPTSTTAGTLASTAGLVAGAPLTGSVALGAYTNPSGSNIVTVTGGGLTSACEGMPVTGQNIPAGTVIEKVQNATTCALSQIPTSTGGSSFGVQAFQTGAVCVSFVSNTSIVWSTATPLVTVLGVGTLTMSTLDCPGSIATIYTDDAGTVSPTVAGQVITDDNGEITFTAAPGDYWLSVAGGKATPQKIELGGTPGFGATVPLVSGNVSVANNVNSPGWAAPFNGQITKFTFRVGTAPATTGIIVRVNKNGTSEGTVTIAASATSGSTWVATGSPLPLAVAAGDILTFDVTQIGTGTVGANLDVDIVSTSQQ